MALRTLHTTVVLCSLLANVGVAFVAAPARSASLMNAKRQRLYTTDAMQMNLFDRFVRVAKSNADNILQKLEDPEKILNTAVDDLQKDLVQVRQSYAEVMATQKRMEKQKAAADDLVAEWYSRAQLAITKGDDELAREALTRKQQQEETAGSLASQISVQADSLGRLYDSMQQLESKITEAKAMKDQYIARARTAKTATKVNDMLNANTGSTSMDAFDRMKEKVEMLETQAEISEEMAAALPGASGGADLESRFKALEGGNKVDDELEAMRQAMLPPAAGGADVEPASADGIDDDFAKLKAEVEEQSGKASV